MKKIALVACVSKKDTRPRPAGYLYASPWFEKASAYVRRSADAWYILSAKHGLVAPEQVIEPYNQTLNTMPAADRRAWADRVSVELRKILKPGDTVIVLAGQRYREHLIQPIRSLGCRVEVPMEGLPIGKQLQWLTRELGR
jgi:hypothetical protein